MTDDHQSIDPASSASNSFSSSVSSTILVAQPRRQRSCAPCAMAKRSCDHHRPYCSRCLSLGITEQCIILEDRRHHKKGMTNVMTEDGIVISTKRTSEYASYRIRTLFNNEALSSSSSSKRYRRDISSSQPLLPKLPHTIIPDDSHDNTEYTSPLQDDILSFPLYQYPSSSSSSSSSASILYKLSRVLDYFTKPSPPTSVINSRQLFHRMHHLTSKLCNVINMIPAWPHDNYLSKVNEVQQLLSSLRSGDEKDNDNHSLVPFHPSSPSLSSLLPSPTVYQPSPTASTIPPVPDNDPFEISNRMTIALLPNPMMRVIFDEPDLTTIVPGTPLTVKQMYYNYRWATVTGAPPPLLNRLAYVLTPQNIVTHVHTDDRFAYLNNIASLVLLRAVRGTFRARYKLYNGWTYADEISDITYYPSGCVRAISITYVNIDPVPTVSFPRDVLQLREAIAKNQTGTAIVEYTTEGDLLFRPDFLKTLQSKARVQSIDTSGTKELTLLSVSNEDIKKYYEVLQTMLQKFTLDDSNAHSVATASQPSGSTIHEESKLALDSMQPSFTKQSSSILLPHRPSLSGDNVHLSSTATTSSGSSINHRPLRDYMDTFRGAYEEASFTSSQSSSLDEFSPFFGPCNNGTSNKHSSGQIPQDDYPNSSSSLSSVFLTIPTVESSLSDPSSFNLFPNFSNDGESSSTEL